MAWVCIDNKGKELMFQEKPKKSEHHHRGWLSRNPWQSQGRITLPKGSIKKLIGRELTWEDEPVELMENSV